MIYGKLKLAEKKKKDKSFCGIDMGKMSMLLYVTLIKYHCSIKSINHKETNVDHDSREWTILEEGGDYQEPEGDKRI